MLFACALHKTDGLEPGPRIADEDPAPLLSDRSGYLRGGIHRMGRRGQGALILETRALHAD
jgi:hypothetical protein